MGYSSVRANPGIVFYSEDEIDHEKVCKGTLSPEGETRMIMKRCVKIPCLLQETQLIMRKCVRVPGLLKEGPADSLSSPQ